MLSKMVSEILGAGAELRNDESIMLFCYNDERNYLLVLVVVLFKDVL
jgi:hypothetical protein